LHYNKGNTQKQTSRLKRDCSFYKRQIQINKSSITFHCCWCYDTVSFRLSFDWQTYDETERPFV